MLEGGLHNGNHTTSKDNLKTIVEEFTRCAEPVGSKTLMELLDFPVSSATIRNEMATLEKLGLLEKTHTSSGRIPSQKGYRYYVEHLMEADLDASTKNALQQVFSERHYSLEEVVQKSCDILSHMTNLTSVVLGPDSRHQTLQHVQLIPINNQSAVAIIAQIKDIQKIKCSNLVQMCPCRIFKIAQIY